MTTAGYVNNADVVEPSGLTGSRSFSDVYYTHNEDRTKVVAISGAGAHRATIRLSGAGALDWEDTAVAACTSGSASNCVYVGDIGSSASNFSRRPGDPPMWQVYKFAEPAALGDATVTPERYNYVYPSGQHWDAEALLVDPASGQIYVFTKRKYSTGVWKFPVVNPANGSTSTLKYVRTIDIQTLDPAVSAEGTKVTGAAAHPCAPRFLLKTYAHNFEFRSATSLSAAITAPDAVLMLPNTAPSRQEEAISYQQDGTGMLTLDELWTSGKGFRMLFVDRGN